MKRNTLLMKTALIIAFCAYFNYQSVFCQVKKNEGPISINIIVERGEDKYLRGASAKLFENGNLISTITTLADGVVNFKLDINKEYIIEISNEGYVSKIVSVNTKLPNYEKTSFEIAFPLLLFAPCEGVDMTVLQSPVVKLVYNDVKRDFLPEKDYDKVMLDKLHQLMKNNDDCIEEKYNSIVRKADRLFAEKKYTDALDTYKKAQNLRPDDQYVIDKISEINRILATQKSNDKLYNDYISQGDVQFNNTRYALAKEFYKRALSLKPNSEYPLSQIQLIDKLLAKKSKEDQDKLDQDLKYQQLISQGDNALTDDPCGKALQAYKDALAIKPSDVTVQQKVNETNKKCKEIQAKNAQDKLKQDNYNSKIAEADKLFNASDFAGAKKAYQEAMSIIPGGDYPTNQISKIDDAINKQSKEKETNLKAKEKETDQQYKSFIKQGDKAFDNEDFNGAKDQYLKAQNLKPDEAYPKDKIKIIDKLLSEQAKADAEKQAKKDAYNNAINKADNLFKSQQYDQALISYKEASTYKPDEQYPLLKIDEINKIKKQNELDKNYKQAVTTGDGYFQKKQFEQAKSAYNQALGYKPNDKYATDQIAKADKEISDQIKKLADQKARQDAYDKAIADGDKNYNLKDYETSKTNYQTALAIFSDKPYPKQRIDEIDKILKQQATDKNYSSTIEEANELLANKHYDEAKAKYKEAGLVKPAETFPSEKIKDIDKILAQNEAEKQKQIQNEKNYNDELKKANELFDKAQYDAAKKEYEKALTFMPDEAFPKQKIAKISEIKNLLAKENKTNASIPVNNPASESKLTDLKFQNDSEREKYLRELLAKYPAGITCEIYKEKKRTITRYIIIRENQANDFREIKYNWGGVDYMRNDKPITQLYFNNQVKVREGEYFTKTEM